MFEGFKEKRKRIKELEKNSKAKNKMEKDIEEGKKAAAKKRE